MKNLDASLVEQFLKSDKERTSENTDFMNNFHMLMPGGFFRNDRGHNNENDRIMDRIDELLNTEFPDIDAAQIQQARLNYIESATPENEQKWQDAKEQMLKIFNRLAELGFDKQELRG
jgi:hypothetical protein